MLQQRKLRMMWSEQQCTGRMHFCAEEKRIKWMHLLIKGAIKFAHWEVEIPHFGGDHITFLILLNVSKVPDGATAGSKEVGILQLTVEVLDHQCDNAPVFIIKGGEDCVDTCFYSNPSVGLASDFALKGPYHISSSIKRSDWKTAHFSHMDFPFDCHNVNFRWLSLSPGSALSKKIATEREVVAFEPVAALRHRAMAGALWPILLPKNQKVQRPRKATQQIRQDKEDPGRKEAKGSNNSTTGKRAAKRGTPSSTLPQAHLQLTPRPVGRASNWDLGLEIPGAGLVRWPEPGP